MADTVTEKLLPCPFCGGRNVFLRDDRAGEEWVECDDCQIGTLATLSYPKCVERWNRRTAPAEPVAWQIYRPDRFVELTISLVAADAATARGWDVIPLYAAPPASPTVSDEMVERAEKAWRASIEPTCALMMRAALLAALGGHHD